MSFELAAAVRDGEVVVLEAPQRVIWSAEMVVTSPHIQVVNNEIVLEDAYGFWTYHVFSSDAKQYDSRFVSFRKKGTVWPTSS